MISCSADDSGTITESVSNLTDVISDTTDPVTDVISEATDIIHDVVNDTVGGIVTTEGTTDTCATNRSLTATTKIPLLLVRVQYADATFQSSETTWADKIFGTSDGQLNHYLDETTYSKYQFTPVSETSGCADDGVVTVTLSVNHPDTRKNSWACYAVPAIRATESKLNYAAYDKDGNAKLSVAELQVIFMVAGGESATGLNSPGGVWAMASSLYCDADLD